MKRWLFREPPAGSPPRGLARELSISPLLLDILWRRGLDSPEELDAYLSARLPDLVPPSRWPQFPQAAEVISKALLDGKPIEGWKLVAGRSIRTFTDQDAAIQAVIAAGYDEALVYDRKPKTLSELEKLMGKAEFAEKIGGYVTKPLGKPTLAPASDKREAYSPAAADFAGVGADA